MKKPASDIPYVKPDNPDPTNTDSGGDAGTSATD